MCHTVGALPAERTRDENSFPTVSLTSQMGRQCFEAFLFALDDYNTDRRGDVGSWSRVAAMGGLESLTYMAVRHLNRVSSTAPLDAEDTNGGSDKSLPWFDESLCVRVIGALFKQLAEKLDSVRAHAGECLSRMLVCTSPTIPFVPSKDHLSEVLRLKPQHDGALNHTNWANAAVTYRMVMAAADVNEFFPHILAGMIISVGGLGESVTKYSEEALLAWVRAKSDVESDNRAQLVADGKKESRRRFGFFSSSCSHNWLCRVNPFTSEFLIFFRHHQRERRIILPLLKTLDTLLNRGYLNLVLQIEESKYSLSLLGCLKAEANRCTDIHTLLAIVSVTLGILNVEQSQQVRSSRPRAFRYVFF